MKSSIEIMQECLDTEVGDQGDVNASTLYSVKLTDIQECIEEAKRDCHLETMRIIKLFEKEVKDSHPEWSYSHKKDYWIEYCKAHKIEI